MKIQELKVGNIYSVDSYLIKIEKIGIGCLYGKYIDKKYIRFTETSDNRPIKISKKSIIKTPSDTDKFWLDDCIEKNDLTNWQLTVCCGINLDRDMLTTIYRGGLSFDEINDPELENFVAYNSIETKIITKGVHGSKYCVTKYKDTDEIKYDIYDKLSMEKIKLWESDGWKFRKAAEDEVSWIIQCYIHNTAIPQDLALEENPYNLRIGEYYTAVNADDVGNTYPNFKTIFRVEEVVKSGPVVEHSINIGDKDAKSDIEYKVSRDYPQYDWVKCDYKKATRKEIRWLDDCIKNHKLVKQRSMWSLFV